jgi:hypothetical protein
MPIVPDDKDWTWVLERPCPECGFDSTGVAVEAVAGMSRANALSWAGYLGAAGPEIRRRPAGDRWAGLEYACHVRDVYRLYDLRLGRMLDEDDPLFANWDQDTTAVEDRYLEQDPATVAPDLVAAAGRLAARFETVIGAQWDRTGNRSDGARFTVASFARYMIHDPIHHLWDVGGAP